MGNQKIQNQIKEERLRAGLTLEGLSNKAGVSVSSLSRYENGENLSYLAMQKIADALNLPVSALMTKREVPEDDKLTYDQVNLQLQASQQHNIYLALICDGQRKTNRLLRIIAVILALFLVYVIIDRFGFPNDGLFHAGG